MFLSGGALLGENVIAEFSVPFLQLPHVAYQLLLGLTLRHQLLLQFDHEALVSDRFGINARLSREGGSVIFWFLFVFWILHSGH